MTPENTLQAECIRWFRRQYPKIRLHSIPNGALIGGKNKFAVLNMLKATGLLKGCPDLFLPKPRGGFHGLYIEMKVGKNKPSPEQKAFIDDLIKDNYGVICCYSFEEFKLLVTSYLKC